MEGEDAGSAGRSCSSRAGGGRGYMKDRGWRWARLGHGHVGLHRVLRLTFGRFYQNVGCSSGRLACA